jgi:hypothetical protein
MEYRMSRLVVDRLQGNAATGNKIIIPAGHDLIAPGHTLQVVQKHLNGRYAQSYSSSVVTDLTDFSATITPKSASSKILIFARWFGEWGNTGGVYNSVWGIKRSGTRIGEQSDPGATVVTALTGTALSYEAPDASSTPETMNLFYMDSPNTTSAITYNIFFITDNASTIYTNRTVNWANQTTGHELGTSTLILMEIGG